MVMADDLRTRGALLVPCSHPDCGPSGDSGAWHFWIDCLDPRLPDGPFLCHDHDPATAGKPLLKADE